MSKIRERIAVVDDDASVRSALCRLLRASGFEAKPYETGADFISSYRSFRPLCAIIDLHMPGMSGLEAQQRLLLDGSPVCVIIITGHDAAHVRSECLAAGVSAYLTKPVDEKVLLSSIAEIVDTKGCRHSKKIQKTTI